MFAKPLLEEQGSCLKILFVSNLFPDSLEPARGFVNARLLHALAKHGDIRVCSPRPTLPILGALKDGTQRQGLAADGAFKPIYPAARYVPKVGSRVNHLLMAQALRPALRELKVQFPFDVILASWIYPDGCAVARLAAEFNVPFVLVAQGSDVHEYLSMSVRRRIITEHLEGAAAVIARSQELARLLEAASVAPEKLRVIYNGVDFDVFKPADKQQARRELGLPPDDVIILYVGGFFPVKNPGLAVASHAQLSQQLPERKIKLVMLGTGPLWQEIRREIGESVIMAGQKTAPEVARYMQAADLLCVPSDNEGVPNVIYEAFACGLKVAATRVGGIPEVLCQDFLGRLVIKGDVAGMTAAMQASLAKENNAQQISEYARRFSWEKTAEAYFDVLQEAVQSFAAGKGA